MIDIEDAKQEVADTVAELSPLVGEITKKTTATLDTLVATLRAGVDTLSTAELRDIMAKISVEAYYIGIVKEQSALQDACATALYKEGYAKAFGTAVGTNAEAKKQNATLQVMDKQAVSILYETVSNLLKTKCDEAHRIVDVIKNILISRASEAKQFYNPRNELDTMNTEEKN